MDWWKSIRRKLKLAGLLSIRDWLGLGQAWWVLLTFSLALRLFPLNRLESFTRVAHGKIAERTDALAWAWQRETMIRMAARMHLLHMTCLPRALSLRWMLSRRGIPAKLCIGVNKSATDLTAHAWVEMDGENIGEAEDIAERFMILK